MFRLLPLASSPARDPDVAGGKAAGLASAAGAGLPVLPGWVVPLQESATAIALGTEALVAGRARAVLAASGVPPPVVELSPGSWIVRSSTPFDDDGRWAGAFASYLDVDDSFLGLAVRACWASAFAADPMGRAQQMFVDPGRMRIAALIQPFLDLVAGGTARFEPDGAVTVTSVRGSPAGLLAGSGSGPTLRVAAGTGASSVATAAAELCRASSAVAPLPIIEWGWDGSTMWLLQVRSAPPVTTVSRPSTRTLSSVADDRVLELARTVTRFPAPLCDELVVPWAIGVGDVSIGAPVAPPEPVRSLRMARASAARLASSVWRSSPEAALRSSRELTRRLLGGRLEDAMGGWPSGRFDLDRAAELVGSIAGLGEHLAGAGAIDEPGSIWRLSTAEIERALLDGTVPPDRLGTDRWEPFVAGVVASGGLAMGGEAVSGGAGAGLVHFVSAGGSIGHEPPVVPPRAVLAAALPVPQLAPLLWRAAAIVTSSGSVTAHLFEVARSLGIPAVVGPDLSQMPSGTLAAVGDDGVFVLPPSARDGEPGSTPLALARGV